MKETDTIVECLFRAMALSLMEQWIEQETVYIERLSDGSIVRHAGRDRLRCIFPRELDLLLNVSGFQVMGKWGNYDRDSLEDDSPRLIVRARAMLNSE